jgi:hypothetical protein
VGDEEGRACAALARAAAGGVVAHARTIPRQHEPELSRATAGAASTVAASTVAASAVARTGAA